MTLFGPIAHQLIFSFAPSFYGFPQVVACRLSTAIRRITGVVSCLLGELLLEIFIALEGTTFTLRRFTLEEWCGRAGNICQLAEAPPIEYASLPHFPHLRETKPTHTNPQPFV